MKKQIVADIETRAWLQSLKMDHNLKGDTMKSETTNMGIQEELRVMPQAVAAIERLVTEYFKSPLAKAIVLERCLARALAVISV